MTPSMKTYTAKATDRERNWVIVDANGLTLGRVATQIADCCAASASRSTRRTWTRVTSSWW